MSIIISDIKISIKNYEDELAYSTAKNILGILDDKVDTIRIYKKSLDARKRTDITFVVSVIVNLYDKSLEENIVTKLNKPTIKLKIKEDLLINYGDKKLSNPIVIIGFGPAGIFSAYLLALHGYNPIVLERGGSVDERSIKVNEFWDNGKLDSNTNALFGEGGAGTFSDGKLTTRISDPLCEYILDKLVEFGAPDDILYSAKPHIGTDKLRENIKQIRIEIEKLGGKVLFNTSCIDIKIIDNKIISVTTNSGEEIETSDVILATGHSARDTFKMIFEKGVSITPKAFSVGVRIEHLQDTINHSLYGEYKSHKNMPIGEYQLSHRQNNRCVYTFCMCPGGYVVPSASSENTVVTNGMSEHSRNGKNANSAIVVSVDEKDFKNHPLGGMYYQEDIEKKAFLMGGKNYSAPANTVREFLNGTNKLKIKSVEPSYSIGVKEANFNKLFNPSIVGMIQVGINKFNTKLKGFNTDDAIITGPETRTSSPIRITRNEELESINIKGLYPCGEGAGYAGGIISASVDGLKVALKIISKYTPK